MDQFQRVKDDVLKKKDKSIKGKIDVEIVSLVDFINTLDDYYTTSSCSGRIVVLEIGEKAKLDSRWIFSSHKTVTSDEIEKSIEELSKKEIWLKQESFILHVACKDIKSAKKVLSITQRLGLKRSGITTLSKKIIVEIMSSEMLSVPLSDNGRRILDPSILPEMIDFANKKMIANRKRLYHLEETMKKEL